MSRITSTKTVMQLNHQWETTNGNSYLSCKDKTPTKYHSCVVYQILDSKVDASAKLIVGPKQSRDSKYEIYMTTPHNA